MSSTMALSGNPPIVLDNLIHNYDFTDYTSGTTITNMMSSAQSASLDNSPTHNKIGYVELDGTNDSLEITPTSIGFGSNGPTCTLDMGFRIPTGTSNELVLFTTNTGETDLSTNNHTFIIYRNSDGKLHWKARVTSSGTTVWGDESTSDLENNVWYHMSIRVSNDTNYSPWSTEALNVNINLNNVTVINKEGIYGGNYGPYRFTNANGNFILGASAPSTVSRTTYPLEIAYFRAYTVKQTDAQRTQNYNHHAGRF